MIREMRHLPEHLLRSVFWDRGTEMADYARIQLALEAKLYFCDPRSPWQRGTNENASACCGFGSRKAATSPATPPLTCVVSPTPSTSDQGRPSASRPQPTG
jgi:IS30 family transposase